MSGSAFADAGLTRATVGVLALVSGINALSTSAYLPALPHVGTDLMASTWASQLTLTAYLVGMAAGQVLWGPLSDRLGRRRPLLVGLSCYVVASLLCAVAPTIALLVAFRAVQGWAACAGTVLSRSVVADHAEGSRMAQLLTLLMLMTVIAPVAAPIIGAWLLAWSWRAVFVFLAVLGVPMLLGVWWRVPESLADADRRRGSLGELGRTVAGLLRDRRFIGYAVALASAFATMFVFLSAAPFLFQRRFAFTAQQYGWVNAGIAGCLGVAMVLVHRHLGRQARLGTSDPAGTARNGILALVAATLCVLAASLLDAPAPVWIGVLAVTASSLAPIVGSALSLALGQAQHAVGTGTATVGVLQSSLGALAAPLAGLGGPDATLPMALAMVVAATVSGVAFAVARRGEPSPA